VFVLIALVSGKTAWEWKRSRQKPPTVPVCRWCGYGPHAFYGHYYEAAAVA
jgi:hypothetical protein